jgi:hypothetical protein
VPPVQLYNRRWNAPPPVTRELWTGEALVFVIVVIVAMPPAIMIPIAMPINATPLQAANHPAGDGFARIRQQRPYSSHTIRTCRTSSTLLSLRRGFRGMADALVATAIPQPAAAKTMILLVIGMMMIAKRLLRRIVAASAMAYASR